MLLCNQVMSMRLLGKIFGVLLIAIPIMLIGGFFYKKLTGHRWSFSLFKAYTLMGNVPGTLTSQFILIYTLI